MAGTNAPVDSPPILSSAGYLKTRSPVRPPRTENVQNVQWIHPHGRAKLLPDPHEAYSQQSHHGAYYR